MTDTASDLPLSGVRVLDLGRVLAAPWATQILGDFGAEIIKVERPERGDDARFYGPASLTTPAGRRSMESAFHLAANRNKRSIIIDLSQHEGQALIRRFAAVSDVVLENFIAGGLARYGLDYASLREVNPRLIYCSITGYGQSGPYSDRPGYDAVFQAQGGLMHASGMSDQVPGGGPLKAGPSLMDVSTGYTAAMAIVAALLQRERGDGTGQHLDVALIDVAIAIQTVQAQQFLLSGRQPPRLGNAQHAAPANRYRCADGMIYISAGADRSFAALCAVLDLSSIAHDARFADAAARNANREALDATLGAALSAREAHPLIARLREAGVACAPVNDYDACFADPQVVSRGVRFAMPHPYRENLELLANPIRLSRTPARYALRPPLLGEHSEEVLGRLNSLHATA